MKYIIDTDPGIDDAIGICLGILNNLDIIGFTLATGNIEKNKSLNNLKTILDILNSNIKIYVPKKENIANTNTAEFAHGQDGLGNIFMPQSTRKEESKNAEDFIIESSYKFKNNLTIVCLGPLTNLASAIKKDPNIVNNISNVIIMGCSYNGDIKPYNEFNVRTDYDSAKLVLTSGFKNINIITHEIGIKSYISKDDMEDLINYNNVSKFIYLISKKYQEFSYAHYKVRGCCMPDPTTISSIIDNDIISYKPCNLEFKNNLIYINLINKSNINVSTDVDNKKFLKLFNETFKKRNS